MAETLGVVFGFFWSNLDKIWPVIAPGLATIYRRRIKKAVRRYFRDENKVFVVTVLTIILLWLLAIISIVALIYFLNGQYPKKLEAKLAPDQVPGIVKPPPSQSPAQPSLTPAAPAKPPTLSGSGLESHPPKQEQPPPVEKQQLGTVSPSLTKALETRQPIHPEAVALPCTEMQPGGCMKCEVNIGDSKERGYFTRVWSAMVDIKETESPKKYEMRYMCEGMPPNKEVAITLKGYFSLDGNPEVDGLGDFDAAINVMPCGGTQAATTAGKNQKFLWSTQYSPYLGRSDAAGRCQTTVGIGSIRFMPKGSDAATAKQIDASVSATNESHSYFSSDRGTILRIQAKP